MNLKCIFRHKYKSLGIQTARGIVDSYSETPLQSGIERCERCGKINKYGFIAFGNLHLNEKFDWQPKIKY